MSLQTGDTDFIYYMQTFVVKEFVIVELQHIWKENKGFCSANYALKHILPSVLSQFDILFPSFLSLTPLQILRSEQEWMSHVSEYQKVFSHQTASILIILPFWGIYVYWWLNIVCTLHLILPPLIFLFYPQLFIFLWYQISVSSLNKQETLML